MQYKKLTKRAINLTGQAFGNLEVLEFDGRTPAGLIQWKCRCVCGNDTTVTTVQLLSGRVESCGCIQEVKIKLPTASSNPAYAVYNAARSRVTNPNNPDWDNYGGRGITMCDEWLEGFTAFWRDMGSTYKPGLCLDRIDNNGNYCKENCRWATRTMQSHNCRKRRGCSSDYFGVRLHKRSNKYQTCITISGKTIGIGFFVSEAEAALAYDNKSEELYGDRPNGTVAQSAINI